MNQKHLLRFIKHKLKYFPDELVCWDKKSGDKVAMSLVQVRVRVGLCGWVVVCMFWQIVVLLCLSIIYKIDNISLKMVEMILGLD